MAELTQTIDQQVWESCKAGAEEAAAALRGALDLDQLDLEIGDPVAYTNEAFSGAFSGPGLVVMLVVEGRAALMLLPESIPWLPTWCAQPDATGQSKLDTLAQELAFTLFPENASIDQNQAKMVNDLAGTVDRGKPDEETSVIPIVLKTGGQTSDEITSKAYLVWPINELKSIFEANQSTPSRPKSGSSKNAPANRVKPKASVDDLPVYAKSLLRVKVPVVVILAQKRQKIGKVLQLGPGSILQFDKSCEETLDLNVGNQEVAKGEAVKVGDKFGLRVTSMVMPDERFCTIRLR